MQWLPKTEARLRNFAPVAADHRNIRIQVEELKASINRMELTLKID